MSDIEFSLKSSSIDLVHEKSEFVSPPPQERKTIALIVESSIFPSVSDAVYQYREDINNTGYQTLLYTVPITTPEALKSLLVDWYENHDLLGAVLIGRLPFAQYHHDASISFSAETFVCDLFLMDLDGEWSDINPVDGIYDAHSSVYPADIYPEIFVGRIDPSCLSWGTSPEQHIINYLSRIHDYRTGGVQRDNRAIAYIDDDWSGHYGAIWSSNLGLAYGNLTSVRIPMTYTNASDWRLNRLAQNYQWGHLCAHSSPTTHYFGPGGLGEGTVTSSQIRAASPSFNFYNLFCCSGAKWTVTDNLAVTYTFSGDYSLAAIGSSKTGSMMDCDFFYGPLSQNANLGESLVGWFSQSLSSSSTAESEYLEWYYGMNIVGDPMLSIRFDHTVLTPEVSSTSHPQQNHWYVNHQAQINWTIPPDVNDIEGYYYLIDQNPSTIPTSQTGNFTTINGTKIEHLDDGTWYFHVVAQDSVGNVGILPAHYQIHIDTTNPGVEIIYPTQNGNYSSRSLMLSWVFQDEFSGYSYAELTLDGDAGINTTESNYMLENLSEGFHLLNITLFDEAGNSNFDVVEFKIDLTNPEITSLTVNEEQDIWPHLDVIWSVQDDSDYYSAQVTFDSELIAVLYAPESHILIENTEYGEHVVNVTIFDWSNRTDSMALTLVIPNLIVQSLGIAAGGILVVVFIMIGWKRKRH